MAEATRPLPKLAEHDTRPFWEATREKQLRFQRCEGCSQIVFYPRAHCPSCGSRSLRWETSQGIGTVYTFSVVRQSYHPFFRKLVPYAVAWIDLDEGPRLLSNVVGVDDPGADVSIGQRVRVEWEAHEELQIPLFRPL